MKSKLEIALADVEKVREPFDLEVARRARASCADALEELVATPVQNRSSPSTYATILRLAVDTLDEIIEPKRRKRRRELAAAAE